MLCLTAGIHSDERNRIEIAHRIYAGTAGSVLAGTLIAMPALNVQGVRSGSRYLPRHELRDGVAARPSGWL
jgi:predicted deacylase